MLQLKALCLKGSFENGTISEITKLLKNFNKPARNKIKWHEKVKISKSWVTPLIEFYVPVPV